MVRYCDQSVVMLGDRVALGGGAEGVVVAIIDECKYSDDFVPEEWSYLERGLLVKSKEFGLIHYPRVVDDLELLSRSDQ